MILLLQELFMHKLQRMKEWNHAFEFQLIKLRQDERMTKQERDMYILGLRFGWEHGYVDTQPEFQALAIIV